MIDAGFHVPRLDHEEKGKDVRLIGMMQLFLRDVQDAALNILDGMVVYKHIQLAEVGYRLVYYGFAVLLYRRSIFIKRQRLPSDSIRCFVTSASEVSYKYGMTRSAPSLAKAMAAALPMPLSPPVTMAILPSSLPLPW